MGPNPWIIKAEMLKRVNGVYRNLDAFHEAFGTQEGDSMWLPTEERVKLW